MENNALIVVEKLNPVEIFQEGGMGKVLAEIETKATAVVADVETDEGRKEIASIAYKVARSKTLIDDVGKAMVTDWKKKAKVVDAARKEARDFLDALKDRVRSPLTEWEAVEAKKKAEAEEKERQKNLKRVSDMQAVGKVVDIIAMAMLTDAEYEDIYLTALADHQAEQERLAEEARQREAEAKRIAEERAELEKLRSEQAERDRIEREKLDSERKAIEAEKERKKEYDDAFESQKMWFKKYVKGDSFQIPDIETVDKSISLLLNQQEHIDSFQPGLQLLINEQVEEAKGILDFRKQQADLEAEKAKIEAEKKADQERRDREEFERQAKIRAEQEAKAKAEREAMEAEEKRLVEEAEKASKMALAPDKDKLLIFADKIHELTENDLSVKSPEARALKDTVIGQILWTEKEFRTEIERL